MGREQTVWLISHLIALKFALQVENVMSLHNFVTKHDISLMWD